MEPNYSLAYYDRIFGCRGAEFWELVEALECQLESYASDLPTVLAARELQALADLRHNHGPMVENLCLTELRKMEQEIREALEKGLPDSHLNDLSGKFGAYAQELARALAAERLSR